MSLKTFFSNRLQSTHQSEPVKIYKVVCEVIETSFSGRAEKFCAGASTEKERMVIEIINKIDILFSFDRHSLKQKNGLFKYLNILCFSKFGYFFQNTNGWAFVYHKFNYSSTQQSDGSGLHF